MSAASASVVCLSMRWRRDCLSRSRRPFPLFRAAARFVIQGCHAVGVPRFSRLGGVSSGCNGGSSLCASRLRLGKHAAQMGQRRRLCERRGILRFGSHRQPLQTRAVDFVRESLPTAWESPTRTQILLPRKVWMPHSLLSKPVQRPARSFSPLAVGRVQGWQPMER